MGLVMTVWSAGAADMRSVGAATAVGTSISPDGESAAVLASDADVLSYFQGTSHSLARSETGLEIVNKSEDVYRKAHYLIQQSYNGIPVYGKYIRAHLDSERRLYAATNETASDIGSLIANGTAVLTGEQAIAALAASVGAEGSSVGGGTSSQPVADTAQAAGQSPVLQQETPKAEPIYYPDESGKYTLAYKVELATQSPVPGRWFGYVDAGDGRVLSKFSRLAEAAADSAPATGTGYKGDVRSLNAVNRYGAYYLVDTTKPMYKYNQGAESGTIETYDLGDPYNPVNAKTSNFYSSNPDAIDAHYFAGQVYDFYLNRFGRDSLDGNGMSIVSLVNTNVTDNAFWDGTEIVYGDGSKQFECLSCAADVVAHELTHGVIEHSADLEYKNQSGALNESFADMMAAVMDDDDWTIGEDTGVAGGSGSGYLRSLQQPELGLEPQPGTMSGYAQLPESNDNGGVHKNSGIPNHAAYLMATGIDEIPQLAGQGRKLMGDMAYGALTSYLTPTAQFADARDAFVLAAGDLPLSGELRSAVIAKVEAAWAAVGLGYTSSENSIVSFGADRLADNPYINAAASTVTFQVTPGTDLSSLSARISVSPGASISPDPAQVRDYASPVQFEVTSENGQKRRWTVTGSIAKPETANAIEGFALDILYGPAMIDNASSTVTLYVEDGDDLTALTPYITVSDGAVVSPASGAPVDLTSERTYTVTAQNGQTRNWRVKAVRDSASPYIARASGSAEGKMIVLSFDQEMAAYELANPWNYVVVRQDGGTDNPVVTKVERDCATSSRVYLTLDRALLSSTMYKVTVSKLKSASGRSVRPDLTTNYIYTNDKEPPKLNTASVNGAKLTLTFDEYVGLQAPVMPGSYLGLAVRLNGEGASVTRVIAKGRHIELWLGRAAVAGDTVTFSYQPDSSSTAIYDDAGNRAAAIGWSGVINRSKAQSAIASTVGWARLPWQAAQAVGHPNAQTMYLIPSGASNRSVVSIDPTTGRIETANVPAAPVRLYATADYVYAALKKGDGTGRIVVLDANDLSQTAAFDTADDPFDLAVASRDEIYVLSRAADGEHLTAYSEAGSIRARADMTSAQGLALSPKRQRLYTIVDGAKLRAYTTIASRLLEADDETAVPDFHPPYVNEGSPDRLWVSPDETYVFSGSGLYYKWGEGERLQSGGDLGDGVDDILFGPFDEKDQRQQMAVRSGNTIRSAAYKLGPNGSSPSTGLFSGLAGDTLTLAPSAKEGVFTLVATSAGATTITTYGDYQGALFSPIISVSTPLNACPIVVDTNTGNPGTGNPGTGNPGTGTPGTGTPGTGAPGGSAPADASGGEPTVAGGTVKLAAADLKSTQETGADGRSIAIVEPDADKLKQALKLAGEQTTAVGTAFKLILPVGAIGDGVKVRLPSGTLTAASVQSAGLTLVVQTDRVTYEIPAKLLGSSMLAQAWGTSSLPDDLQLEFGIVKPAQSEQAKSLQLLRTDGYAAISDFLDFTIELASGGKKKELKNFNGIYVTKRISIDAPAAAGEVTALTYDSVSGQLAFVPAAISVSEGRLTAAIRTPHNSLYVLAQTGKSFADIATHPDRAAIEKMAAKKLVLGAGAGRFQPDRTVTRAEFAALLARALGLQTLPAAPAFADVKAGAWYGAPVTTAVSAGLISGYGNGSFGPGGVINRQELAVMLGRAIAYAGGLPKDAGKASSGASVDAAKIPAWAAADAQALLAAGIMRNRADGSFAPAAPVTRAEAAVSLMRMLERLQLI
ncbi:M4 family metallopeptidase [Cohnella hashimotonis]|uniref:M4 family metallopeptidase n=1 Tax=Cohnella hashimotonis TaxID=2826895 RepID=A0ABT6TPC1_9BACL|nr:M4 family metallopeptidase [Cohnella hashimotonis]MDI4648584.1 M4 family metallopeptidase [Cohnella hashimotonis]